MEILFPNKFLIDTALAQDGACKGTHKSHFGSYMKTSLKILFAKWLERPIFQESAASLTVYSTALRKLKSLSIFPGVLMLNANDHQPTPTPSALPLRYLEGVSALETTI